MRFLQVHEMVHTHEERQMAVQRVPTDGLDGQREAWKQDAPI